MTTPNVAKKRDRTRDKLLIAVQELLLDRSAGSLSIRDITTQAEMVHGSFYNYFDSVEAVVQGVAELFYRLHYSLTQRMTQDIDDPAEIFALKTRQSLLFMCQEKAYGHLLFDAGLRIDQLVVGLRLNMRTDIEQGINSGRFVSLEPDLMLSQITGTLLGVALDLHRGVLPLNAIEKVTANLLQQLGLMAEEAQQLAHKDVKFIQPLAPPLSGHKLQQYLES